jgi:hypothetical protein
MNHSSNRAAAGVLRQSQRSDDTNGETANDDEEFLEDRAANGGRHILTLLSAAQIALTHYLQV